MDIISLQNHLVMLKFHLFPLLLLAVLSGPLAAQDTTVVDIIVDSDDHNTLEAAVLAADLATTLSGEGPFTVFAPTDSAFSALPEGTLEFLLDTANRDSLVAILTYHVVGDSVPSSVLTDGMFATTVNEDSVYIRVTEDGVMVNNAMVTMADIAADNGVVHVIDAVLLPPPATVVDVVVSDTTLTTLETAVTQAQLVDALSGEGPFTVFAPNDTAFADLEDGLLDSLLADPTGDLATILQFHVVPGRFMSSDLAEGAMLTTLEGEALEISLTGGATVNDIAILRTDLLAGNGVVHVIGGVLLPNSITSVGEPAFAAEVSIAPNPAAGYTTVFLPAEILDRAELTLRSMDGRVVNRQRATNQRERLNLGQLPTGTYLLEIRADAGTIQRRIVVRR
jgi:uncharacterized surface protein with fasciclin (FAS1) repeats